MYNMNKGVTRLMVATQVIHLIDKFHN